MDELETIRARKLEELMTDMQPPSVRLERKMPNKPVEVTDQNFSSMIRDYGFIVVDCWAPWCGPCRMLAPIIDQLARDYEGRVVFGKLNTDNNRLAAGQFGIMSIPTLLFFKNGRLVDTMIGAGSRRMIEEKIIKYI
ncbi:MAG: thioredoxin [Thermoplasmata archaeon]|nr:MAG: thioredoxin [Thermoplasmata archaeon]